MTTLTQAARDALPDNAFGLPEARSYPMPDVAHARNAKARAAEEFNAGKLSAPDRTRIDRMADAVLAQE